MALGICSANLSIGVINLMSEQVLSIENNRVLGIVGSKFDQFLVHKGKRECILKPIYELEHKIYPNESVEYLMNRNRLDFYSRAEEIGLAKENVEMSTVVGTRILTAGQSLGTLKHQPSDFLSFLYQNKDLVIILASGHLLVRLIVFLFMRTVYSKATRRSPNLKWLHQTYRRIESHLSKLTVLFVFLGLFDFIILTLLINSIKTDKLVIDTSYLIDSQAKLKSTEARPMFFEMESDYRLISEAPEHSQLFRLFHSKFKRKDGFFLVRKESPNQDMFKYLQEDPKTYYLFMNSLSLHYTAFLASSFFENLFFKPVNYYETLNVAYLRKNLEKSKKSDLIKKISASFEHGFYGDLNKKIEDSLLFEAQKSLRVFTSQEEYVGEFDKIADVKLDNFENLFLGFAVFSLLVLLCFLVDVNRRKLRKLIRRSLRKMKRRLSNHFTGLWNRLGTLRRGPASVVLDQPFVIERKVVER